MKFIYIKNNSDQDVSDFPINGAVYTVKANKTVKVDEVVGGVLLNRFGGENFLTLAKAGKKADNQTSRAKGKARAAKVATDKDNPSKAASEAKKKGK